MVAPWPRVRMCIVPGVGALVLAWIMISLSAWPLMCAWPLVWALGTLAGGSCPYLLLYLLLYEAFSCRWSTVTSDQRSHIWLP